MSKPLVPELFASDDQVAELEASQGEAPAAMTLAWALRQRDPERCLLLARAAAQADSGLLARLWLIEGERATGHYRLDEAQAFCDRAAAALGAAGDLVGCMDALLLDTLISRERSAMSDLVGRYTRVLEAAERAGEPGRIIYGRVNLARQHMWSVGLEREPVCLPLLPTPEEAAHPAIATVLAIYRSFMLVHRGDNPGIVKLLHEAYALSQRSGHGLHATVTANNLALMYDEVGETALALEWAQTALALARRIWPAKLGMCLRSTALVLRHLGHLQEARELLLECLKHEAPWPESREAVHARIDLGLIALAGDEPEAALADLDLAIQSPYIQPVNRAEALGERGEALLRLQRYEEAAASASAALEMDPNATMLVQMIRTRALLANAWLALGRVSDAHAAYARLLADCDTLPDYKPWASTLEGAARAHAAVGQHEQAYALSQRAAETRERRHSQQAEQRSRVLTTQFRTERAQLEAEHMGRLAQAAAERLAALERSHSVLDQLGSIGRELTAQLDADRALAVLAQHVRLLLPVDCLIVYLLEPGGHRLECALCEDQGVAVPCPPLTLDDPQSLIARCARERAVLLLQDADPTGEGIRPAGTARKRSLFFAPLSSGARLVGVLSVQSGQAGAFGPESQLIFGTLCAYAAIALDNARAYQQLGQMQRHLRAQERMASLGFMVAGVAHELNTPLGNALMAVSTVTERSAEFAQKLSQGALRRSDWETHARTVGECHALIRDGVETASRLVSNFRQVSQRRDTEQRRRFNLAQQCGRALELRLPELQRAGHRLEIDMPPGLELESYTHAIGQALDLLVSNALLHGLMPDKPGTILLRAEPVDDEHCRLELSDDGRGMTPEVLERAFEPFFTTTFGKGSNGLGLSICHSLVADVLGGRISAHSEPDQGACFVLELPLVAP